MTARPPPPLSRPLDRGSPLLLGLGDTLPPAGMKELAPSVTARILPTPHPIPPGGYPALAHIQLQWGSSLHQCSVLGVENAGHETNPPAPGQTRRPFPFLFFLFWEYGRQGFKARRRFPA